MPKTKDTFKVHGRTFKRNTGSDFRLPVPAYSKYLTVTLHAALRGVYDKKLADIAYAGYVTGDVKAIEEVISELKKKAGIKGVLKKLGKSDLEKAHAEKAKLFAASRKRKKVSK